MSHTPGPWQVNPDIPHLVGNGTAEVANLYWGELISGMEMRANARLIAAAPELLEALKAVIEWDDDCPFMLGEGFGELRERIETAIAKAEGR